MAIWIRCVFNGEIMKIHIVCYDDVHTWILGKFAIKMDENLHKLGIQSTISDKPDLNADINHHLIYTNYNGEKTTIDTVMITHIDRMSKFNMLQNQMKAAGLGICMSRETMVNLAKMGIEKNKLCYVNPAHDGTIPIKKIVVGIASRTYIDGRKNEYYLNKLADKLNHRYFKFKIFGNGWEPQVKYLNENNFEVEYTEQFDYDKYLQFIPSLDYYLYMGTDEGQMGFVDALSAGVKTIVVPQGYHLDANNGITHPFTTYNELENILLQIQKEKELLVSSVDAWNWFNYTKKHVEIWQYLIDNKKIRSDFSDGINSLWEHEEYDDGFKKKESIKLKKNEHKQIRHALYTIVKTNGLLGSIRYVAGKFFNRLRKKYR